MIYALGDRVPRIAPDCFVAPNATLIGSVIMESGSSVWFNVVIRADHDTILIGARSNIQDAVVMHVDHGVPLTIGEDVTVGHKAMLHGCTVGAGSLVGINAVVLNRAVIGRNCLIAANALVTERMVVPDGSVVMGSPGKVVRTMTEEQQREMGRNAIHYVENGRRFREELRLLANEQ